MDYIPGNYKAIIKDYGFKTTRNGDLQFAILFRFNQNGTEKQLTWYGSLKEGKAMEITIETLKTLGYRGQDLEQLNDGIDSRILNAQDEFEIVVDIDEYNGRKIPKIKWINIPGQSFHENKLSKDDVKMKLKGINIKPTLIEMFGMKKPKTEEWTHDNQVPF